MNEFAPKSKSYVSKQIALFVHVNSLLRLCKFRRESMQLCRQSMQMSGKDQKNFFLKAIFYHFSAKITKSETNVLS